LGTLLYATLELVKFADSKNADKAMKHSRLIFPQGRYLSRKVHLSADEGNTSDGESVARDNDSSSAQEGLSDPEHLPPANSWERAGNSLRSISHFLASDQSVFGFRAAAASFTVAIPAYLHQTQDFFFQQRLIWALIVIVIGMSPTSRASLFSFARRILGTTVSLVLSLAVWYIVNGHTAGVIVFLYVANVFEVSQ
jgi:Fusaric acid resistance protein-like